MELLGVEWETSVDTPEEERVILGTEMDILKGGHADMEFDHYLLHLWFVENPLGEFAPFNPSLECPAEEA